MSNSIKIESIQLLKDGHRLEFDIIANSISTRIYFQVEGAVLTPSAEAFVLMTLLPAMKLGSEIEIEEAVSGKLISSLPDIQSILRQWFPEEDLKKFPIENIPLKRENPPKNLKSATFSSGGIDSYYSLIKNQSEITDIIFIKGFDIKLNNEVLLKNSLELVQKIGNHFNKNVIVIETNLKLFLNRYVNLRIHFGVFLSSIAHLLSNRIRKVFIPAGDSYARILPHGSHPLLDPMFSSESMQIVHDGCESTRLEKLKTISDSDFAVNNLRVCFNAHTSFLTNCEWCEKCIRTKLGLLIINKLSNNPSFKKPIEIGRIRKLKLRPNIKNYYTEILYELEKTGEYPELCYAVSSILNQQSFIKTNRELMQKYLQRLKYKFPNLYDIFYLGNTKTKRLN